MPSAIEKVEDIISKFNMLTSNDRVVVAVSGGPDSVALVYILNNLGKNNVRQLYLHLAHLNHMIRKKEAAEDNIFVENLAKRLNLPLTCESINVEDFAKGEKLSIEEAARKIRYNFLAKVAKENSASKIALGHNRDDQAETVLMRFLRGSGISGLRGIPLKRQLGGCLIIRPLIGLWRKEIIRFLLAKNISFRTDSSNLENLYLRNRIRNKLIPLLEEDFNPNIKEILVNLAQNSWEDFDYLEKMGKRRFKSVCTTSNKKEIKLNIKKLLSLHKALQKLVLRSAIKELQGNTRRLTYRHWEELENLIEYRPKHSIVDLPRGISVSKKNGNLVLYLIK